MRTDAAAAPDAAPHSLSLALVSQIFVCLLCSQRYKKAGNFVTHVQTHEVTAAAMLAELQQQAAQQTAASVQQAETDEDAPRFFVSAMQVVVQYSCKLCQPHITLYEKLSELQSVESRQGRKGSSMLASLLTRSDLCFCRV